MPRVLIVDDSAFARALVRNWLQKAGYETLEAVDGAEGLTMACEEKPDLIILDLLMPHLQGDEVLAAMRERALDIPVVVASANIQDGMRQKCQDLGALEFINKPPVEEKLLAIVSRFIAPPNEALG